MATASSSTISRTSASSARRAPGTPSTAHAAGIEATTGPLGQGISTCVGLALAERMLAARYNRPAHALIDHYTFTICSDGDLEEGISSEASSLAGHLGLGRLIAFYDDNHISIEGNTDVAFSEDVGARYEAYGWHVQHLGEDISVARLEEAGRARDGRHRSPVADHLPYPHRLRLAEQAGHAARRTARRSARKRSA